jgi:hypothetical protein
MGGVSSTNKKKGGGSSGGGSGSNGTCYAPTTCALAATCARPCECHQLRETAPKPGAPLAPFPVTINLYMPTVPGAGASASTHKKGGGSNGGSGEDVFQCPAGNITGGGGGGPPAPTSKAVVKATVSCGAGGALNFWFTAMPGYRLGTLQAMAACTEDTNTCDPDGAVEAAGPPAEVAGLTGELTLVSNTWNADCVCVSNGRRPVMTVSVDDIVPWTCSAAAGRLLRRRRAAH